MTRPRLLDRLPSWLRAGVVTGTFVAVPGFIAALLDVVDGIASWAAGETVGLPDLSTLRAAAVAVVVGGIVGGLNAAYRLVQERLGRGNPPVYPSRPTGVADDRGQSTRGIAVTALVIAVIVLLILLL